ncbi:MAG: hypothetical protein JXB38_05735 [Anaerolineales bacterium]|nr:hypothetical protein [Anaerolineales bacterium]
MINLFDPKYEPYFVPFLNTSYTPKAVQHILRKQFCGPAAVAGICEDNIKEAGFCTECSLCETAFKNAVRTARQSNDPIRNPYALMTWLIKNELGKARELKFEKKPTAKTKRDLFGERVETVNPFDTVLETL